MVSRRIVNASPLILLTRVNLLGLLQEPGVEVVVPDEVVREIAKRGLDDPTVVGVNREEWLRVVPSPRIPNFLLEWKLGPGESSVLALAEGISGSEVILDDLAARRCAKAHSIPFRGTLSLILIAKEDGTIPAARPVLLQLRQSGMYLSDRILEMALAQVGESLSET